MGWLILHPPCFLGFFLASGSGAVDGRGGAFALGYLDEAEEDVGWAIDFSIATFTGSMAFLGIWPAAFRAAERSSSVMLGNIRAMRV